MGYFGSELCERCHHQMTSTQTRDRFTNGLMRLHTVVCVVLHINAKPLPVVACLITCVPSAYQHCSDVCRVMSCQASHYSMSTPMVGADGSSKTRPCDECGLHFGPNPFVLPFLACRQAAFPQLLRSTCCGRCLACSNWSCTCACCRWPSAAARRSPACGLGSKLVQSTHAHDHLAEARDCPCKGPVCELELCACMLQWVRLPGGCEAGHEAQPALGPFTAAASKHGHTRQTLAKRLCTHNFALSNLYMAFDGFALHCK